MANLRSLTSIQNANIQNDDGPPSIAVTRAQHAVAAVQPPKKQSFTYFHGPNYDEEDNAYRVWCCTGGYLDGPILLHKLFDTTQREAELKAIKTYLNEADPLTPISIGLPGINVSAVADLQDHYLPLRRDRVILSSQVPITSMDFVNNLPKPINFGMVEEFTDAGITSQLLLSPAVQESIQSGDLEAIIARQIESALGALGIYFSEKITLTINADIGDRKNLSAYEQAYIKYCTDKGYECIDINGKDLIEAPSRILSIADVAATVGDDRSIGRSNIANNPNPTLLSYNNNNNNNNNGNDDDEDSVIRSTIKLSNHNRNSSGDQ